jgi:nanoRNase/pAp phosphatase (c-di-AMP/oligoRNAs hydrolase)
MTDAATVKVSLRSCGEEDTTVISAAFGGGGHKNASSFLLNAKLLETWKRMKR